MTYFNPKVYNKENLKPEDLQELEYWNDIFQDIVNFSEEDFFVDSHSYTLDEIIKEVVHTFADTMRRKIGFTMQEHVVSRIDDYDGDVEMKESYTTFEYEGEKENG